ncbi:YigZ family protein [Aeromicrobium chenweiae]|uniref:YigZ family protein n=1 Tax=Aeromicrobium chenweiae TaxID=2079793 RepID=A0A2S0WRC4_9ACTN|nr:YigZ family protein [Aeromicrobium chenweiae]AWB93808.1 YigZ family protein [Aeromicrobium chenweiae]TGN30853.1 YigZ family protein [Aeromicrobium chenweiae]
MSAYTTIARDATAQIEVKHSVFLCTVQRVETEVDARALVARLRKDHWDARHHCSAFVIGPEGRLQRSSDDGEPSGTAGAPMLDVVVGAGLSDVAVVVTRWFGGTLLGAGGLVRAYSDATRAGLDEAGTLRRELVRELETDVDAADAGRVENELRNRGIAVLDVSWGERVRLRLGAAPDDVARLASVLAELTGGTAEARPVGERWVDR